MFTLPDTQFPQMSYTAPSGAVLSAVGSGASITANGLGLTALLGDGVIAGSPPVGGGAPVAGAVTLDGGFVTATQAGLVSQGAGIISATNLMINAGQTAGAWLPTLGDGSNTNRMILASSSIDTAADDVAGLLVDSSARLDATNVAIRTSGDGAHGVAASGTVTYAGGSIETGGNGARGLVASGTGSISAAGTAGNPLLITINGDDGIGALATGGASVTVASAQISVRGGTGTDAGAAAFGTGSTLTLTDSIIVAPNQGAGAYGVGVEDGGHAIIRGGSISSVASALRVQQGGIIDATDVALSASGASAIGVNVNHGTVNLSGGSITTTGNGSHGMNAASGTDSIINADGVTVDATGNGVNVGNSSSVKFSNGSVRSSQSHGVRAISAGAAALSNSTIIASSDNVFGLLATGENSSIAADTVRVSTLGEAANGLQADNAGNISFASGTVDTQGQNAIGLFATGIGSAITTGGLLAVTTRGAFAHGVQAQLGGRIATSGSSTPTLRDVAISTQGADAYGVYAIDPGTRIDGTGLDLTTTGSRAFAIFVQGGATVTLATSTIATQGAFGVALRTSGAGSGLTATGLRVSTLGGGAHGAEVLDDGRIGVAGSTISTTGPGASALVLSGRQARLNVRASSAAHWPVPARRRSTSTATVQASNWQIRLSRATASCSK
ncbi:hypothetical protein MNR01_13130 [Lysobacter sp. S4-A87]|uniref:beta strand repeat-containing protein n=1 Tax=Lysobacter sp. S4-A87 TaxID=2925843 RepID=UPI001F53626D|nr:hypothetical protein [Lysobacter sp. S4-A87]UNK48680.1 hypothetical protein MNR01_13130 [Lysobacter sp. S4-A87]